METQREYNIASEIYHSGFKRAGKKYIGRARRSIADKLIKLQRGETLKQYKAFKELNNIKKSAESDKVLGRKLAKEANKRGIRVFDKDKVSQAYGGKNAGENYILDCTKNKETMEYYKNKASKYPHQNTRKVAAAIGTKGKVINLSGDYDKSWDTLAHEIGHDMNRDGKVSKVIKKLSNFQPKTYKHDSKKSGIRNEVGSIMTSAKNKLGTAIKNSEIPKYLEERNAWKNARKLMKRNGATKAQLEQFDKNRKSALKTYKTKIVYNKLGSLRNKVILPTNNEGFLITSKQLKRRRIARSKRYRRQFEE